MTCILKDPAGVIASSRGQRPRSTRTTPHDPAGVEPFAQFETIGPLQGPWRMRAFTGGVAPGYWIAALRAGRQSSRPTLWPSLVSQEDVPSMLEATAFVPN